MSAPSHIRPATRGDLPEILDVLVACDIAETGEADTTPEDLENDWDRDGFQLGRDAWVAETVAGELVAYAYAGDQYRTGELEAGFWVHPRHEEPGLAERLLGLAERHAAEIAAERGYEEPALGLFFVSSDRAKRGLLEARGYAVRRTMLRMTIDLGEGVPELPVPDGLEIRPFRLEADERTMYDAMNEAFQEYFRQSDEPFDAWKARLLGHADFDPGLWWLAWDGDQPAGALIAYDYGDLGLVKGLGVRLPWRRRGLGGAMLAHAFAEFARRGQLRVDLAVDQEGETRPLRVYERAGMQVLSSYELFLKHLAR